VRNKVKRLRRWLALAGGVAAIGVLVPPAGTAARQYVFAQAVQFAVLAVVVPALVVLGAPWRLGTSLTNRLASARSHRTAGARTWAILVGFIAVALAWRLPAAVNALVSNPLLTILEAITLIGVGCALWLELVESPPLLPRISRPQRALFAALPMWALWASAYIMGFSRTTWFRALAHSPGHGLGTVADQEIAAGLLWAIPALCFVPVVYVALISWLRDSADPDDELRAIVGTRGGTGAAGPRPPRGWRLPPA
jgi:cytochrome c oxidase assembly factor CtaG